MNKFFKRFYAVQLPALLLLATLPNMAQAVALDSKKPVEITADALEVRQQDGIAIFTGNVIAVQGNINMRAAKMDVYYREKAGDGSNEIYKIVSTGKVLFTTPAETANGDAATYLVDKETIYLHGNVTLSRDKNILKGDELEYNLATGRSVVTGGATVKNGEKGSGRVRGLFMPKQK